MPTFGALELTAVVDRLPTVRDLDTEAWSLPGAEILQLAFEVPRATESLLPRAMHPAFYGCFDWHSTVHGHWMLVHLLKAFPGTPE